MSFAHFYSQALHMRPQQLALRLFLSTWMILAMLSTAHAANYHAATSSKNNAQTIHHCGWIRAHNEIYTQSARNTAIIQRKLARMGYYSGAVDGFNSAITKAAVAQFQREYGLKIDGIVGIETATAIGYVANNASWVRNCHRAYGALASR